MKNLFDLTGKVAVVIGGSRGLGRGMAQGLADAGATVVIASRGKEALMQAAAELSAETGSTVGHNFDQQVASDKYKATGATCESKATYYYSCECGEKSNKTFEYGELGSHKYIDGTCSECGSKEITVVALFTIIPISPGKRS